MVFIHCSGAELPVFSYAWNVKMFVQAHQKGIPIRQVGFSRVLREEIGRVDTRSSQESIPENERDTHRSFVQSVGGYDAIDELIKVSMQETIDAFLIKTKQNGCGPECWGMSMTQLRSVRESMIIKFPKEYRTFTMASTVEKVVKPTTAGHGLGWALLHNSKAPLSPDFLISHAWSELFDEFVEAIIHHGLKEVDTIWVCSFALYQNQEGYGPSIADQLGLDLKEGPFSLILATPPIKGLIAVHTSSEDLYSRLWCILELADAVQGGVDIFFAGDPKVIGQQLQHPANSVKAVCGPAGLFYMVDDTRKIRAMLERAWGTACSRRGPGSGEAAYLKLNSIIHKHRAAVTNSELNSSCDRHGAVGTSNRPWSSRPRNSLLGIACPCPRRLCSRF